MNQLEDFLAGKPLNGRMERLMRGEDDEEPVDIETAIARKEYADGTPITDNDREHLRRMLNGAGWQVLLKLLDTELKHQEDTARRTSLDNPLARKDEIATMWGDLAAAKKARNGIVTLAEAETRKLQKAKAKAGTKQP